MGKFILRDVSISVNTADLSDHGESVEIDYKWPDKDVTGFGAAFQERLLGIGDATIKINFFNDFDSGSVEDTLTALAGSNTPFPLVITEPDSGTTYTMQAVLATHSPLKGKVGEPTMTEAEFLNADQSGVVKS